MSKENTTQAAANKAAEEGKLPKLPQSQKTLLCFNSKETPAYSHQKAGAPYFEVGQMIDYALAAIAADRAARPVANKAEVEQDKIDAERYRWLRNDPPLTLCVRRLANNGASEYLDGVVLDAAINVAMRLASPPATTGAGTAIELDAYDAGLLSDFGGGDVNWWQDYIRAELDRAHDFYQSQVEGSVGASTVLTDERSQFEDYVRNECDSEEYADSILGKNSGGFYHAVRIQGAWEGWQARSKVAAQAGQVAVPGWISVDARLPDDDCRVLAATWFTMTHDQHQDIVSFRRGTGKFSDSDVTHWMPLPAAPSPAKESK